jgi:hypothetical protein
MNYPYFLGHEDHRLGDYYKTLNRLSFVLIPVLFALNELFVRPSILAFKASPERLWSIIALALNAQIPESAGASAYLVIALFMPVTAILFFVLPKWGVRATTAAMKSGLPSYTEYSCAHFQIKNLLQRTAFFGWHRVLMPIAFFLGICSLYMTINLFRSLS